MLSIPKEIIIAYDALLSQKQVPIQQRALYIKWLRFYLDFCHKYHFDAEQSASLPAFIDKLRSKKQSDVFCQQAKQAVLIYAALKPDRDVKNNQPLTNAENKGVIAQFVDAGTDSNNINKPRSLSENRKSCYEKAILARFSVHFR